MKYILIFCIFKCICYVSEGYVEPAVNPQSSKMKLYEKRVLTAESCSRFLKKALSYMFNWVQNMPVAVKNGIVQVWSVLD